MYINQLHNIVTNHVFCATFSDLVLAEARKVTTLAESSSGEDDKDEPPAKTPRLFTGYRKKSNKKDDPVSSVKAELIRYMQVSSDEEEADCLGFWKRHAKVFPRLYLATMRVLAVPATSAPVERVFSHGGLIMRPHRAWLSARTLSCLIFLKCNHSVA